MAKRLIVSKNAYIDIDRIIEFNNTRNQSETYSRKFVRKIFNVFKVLSKQPLLGIRTNIESILLLIWDDYYIFYSLVGDTIIINAVYHQNEAVNF